MNKKTIMIIAAVAVGYYFWSIQSATTTPVS